MVYIKSKLWNALIGNTKSISSSTGQSDPNYSKQNYGHLNVTDHP